VHPTFPCVEHGAAPRISAAQNRAQRTAGGLAGSRACGFCSLLCSASVTDDEKSCTKETAPPTRVPVAPSPFARRRCDRNRASTRRRSTFRSSFGSFTIRKRSANGSDNVH